MKTSHQFIKNVRLPQTDRTKETWSPLLLRSLSQLPRLTAFPLFAIVGQIAWMTSASAYEPIALVIWIPLLAYSWFCIGGLSHELIHANLPLPAWLNVKIAKGIGVLVLVPYNVYREVHMRHHAYLNTPLDWELWPYSDPAASLRFRRCFVWFDLCCGAIATPVIWGRICFSAKSPSSAANRRAMRIEYLTAAVFWFATIGICVWLHQTGRFTFLPRHLIFAVPPLLAANLNSVRKMMEHIGTSSFDPVHGTRTVVGASLATKVLSYLDFDLAVHGPHHRHPKLDHSLLKNRMSEIQANRPDETFPVYSSFTAALVDTFRTLFTNPAVGVNAGCKSDISHLPGLETTEVANDGEAVLASK